MQTLELEQHTTGSIPAPDWKYAIMREHPSILTVIVLCLMGGGLAALLEVWAVMCLSLSQFTLYGILWTVPQLPFLLYRTSRRKTAVMVAFWIVLVILWAIPWSSRKVFLRDFDRIHIGMSRNDVQALMGRYIEGTGWPALPADKHSSLSEVSTGAKLDTRITETGELGFVDSLVYRHSDEGSFNADWGVIRFRDDKVTSTEFMPD